MIMRGLGTMYKTDPDTGNVIDCDAWSNLFQGVCWNPAAPTVVIAPGTGGSSGTPATPAAGACNSTIITGICDMYLYIGGAAFAGIVVLMMLGGRR